MKFPIGRVLPLQLRALGCGSMITQCTFLKLCCSILTIDIDVFYLRWFGVEFTDICGVETSVWSSYGKPGLNISPLFYAEVCVCVKETFPSEHEEPLWQSQSELGPRPLHSGKLQWALPSSAWLPALPHSVRPGFPQQSLRHLNP